MQQQREHWVYHSSDTSSNGSLKRHLLLHRKGCRPKREHAPLRNGRKAIAQRRHFLMKPLAVKRSTGSACKIGCVSCHRTLPNSGTLQPGRLVVQRSFAANWYAAALPWSGLPGGHDRIPAGIRSLGVNACLKAGCHGGGSIRRRNLASCSRCDMLNKQQAAEVGRYFSGAVV